MLKTKNSLVTLAVIGATLLATPLCHANFDDVKNKGKEVAVEIRLALKDGIPSTKVDAHVNKDVIQFAGFVDNKAQYNNVQKIASTYEGKYKVINNVKILSARDNSSDEDLLKHNILCQLRDYKYPVEEIDVQVRNGHVILSGFVGKHIPLNEIKDVSLAVPGTLKVDNYLLYKQA